MHCRPGRGGRTCTPAGDVHTHGVGRPAARPRGAARPRIRRADFAGKAPQPRLAASPAQGFESRASQTTFKTKRAARLSQVANSTFFWAKRAALRGAAPRCELLLNEHGPP